MPVWALAALGAVGTTVVNMLMKLLTEAFIRKVVILGMERVVLLTETDVDNQLLRAAKEAWQIEEGQ